MKQEDEEHEQRRGFKRNRDMENEENTHERREATTENGEFENRLASRGRRLEKRLSRSRVAATAERGEETRRRNFEKGKGIRKGRKRRRKREEEKEEEKERGEDFKERRESEERIAKGERN